MGCVYLRRKSVNVIHVSMWCGVDEQTTNQVVVGPIPYAAFYGAESRYYPEQTVPLRRFLLRKQPPRAAAHQVEFEGDEEASRPAGLAG